MNHTIKHIFNPIYGFTKGPNSFYNLTSDSRSEAGLVNFISGADRGQAMLLPSMVEDYIAADAAVRVIDAFVDSLDVLALGFERPTPAPTGRPGYDPRDMLRLYIYGDLNRVRSSRRLEAETYRNFEMIWLLRGLRPDFKTIADFRRDNRAAFKAVFREFVLLCRTLDLYGRELVAVDGTRLKAVNSRDRNFTREKFVGAPKAFSWLVQ